MVAVRRRACTPASAVFVASNVDTPRRAVRWPCARRRCAPMSSGAGWPFATRSALCALRPRTRLTFALWARSRLSSLPCGRRRTPRTTASSLLTTRLRGLALLGLLWSPYRWRLPLRGPSCLGRSSGRRLRRTPRGRLAPRPPCHRSPQGGLLGRFPCPPGRGGHPRWTLRLTRTTPRTILPTIRWSRRRRRRLPTPFALVQRMVRCLLRQPRRRGRTLWTPRSWRRPGQWTPCGRLAMSLAAQPAEIPARSLSLPGWPVQSAAPRLGVACSLRPALAAGWWLCPDTATRCWFGWSRSPSRPGRLSSLLRRRVAPPWPVAATPSRLLTAVVAAAPCCGPAVVGGRLRLAAA